MEQKRDANGKFVKMYPSREEYEAKIKTLRAELDDREKSLVRVDNELKFWKQEFVRVKNLNREQEIFIKKVVAMRNWLYNHAGCITKYRYNKAKEKGLL